MRAAFANERAADRLPLESTESLEAKKGAMALARQAPIYGRNNDIRSEFERDYTRILHCQAFRRLKHKTQVFFAPQNDHICTRMEHVLHVESVAGTIAKYLGLNSSLTSAIAIGHDIGHAPFGHYGEECLNEILAETESVNPLKKSGDSKEETAQKSGIVRKKFWHERNSLFFADYIETLPDPEGIERQLNLTYAVRDGLICHCGEIDQQGIKPRNEAFDLYSIKTPGTVQPFTWEGCVVKVADKIAYLGRDLEDARLYNIIDMKAHRRLKEITETCLRRVVPAKESAKNTVLNTTVLINELVADLCNQSSPSEGLNFSPAFFDFIVELKKFSYKFIYSHWRLLEFQNYAGVVLRTIWRTLLRAYPYVKSGRIAQALRQYRNLSGTFEEWLIKYTEYVPEGRSSASVKAKYAVRPVFDIADEASYHKCVLEYISGMTDIYAIKVFEEIVSF